MKVDARHGVKGLFPASEGYFLDARNGAHPLVATCWALSHLHALHLTTFPLTLYHLDAAALDRCAALTTDGNTARDPIDRMVARLLGPLALPKLEPCAKGFFFDQMTNKLTQLMRGGFNEVVPADLHAMAESVVAAGSSHCESTP